MPIRLHAVSTATRGVQAQAGKLLVQEVKHLFLFSLPLSPPEVQAPAAGSHCSILTAAVSHSAIITCDEPTAEVQFESADSRLTGCHVQNRYASKKIQKKIQLTVQRG